MFNYVKVFFPENTFEPQRVYSFELIQERYHHEIMKIVFKDWNINVRDLNPGTTVRLVLYGPDDKRDICGYVHHITPNRTPGTNFTEITVVGASFPLKSPAQTIYKNITADQIAEKIAEKHNFVCYSTPHPRVYPQVSQSGHTDWEFLVRLAKQCGYSLRAENTELYFNPILDDYTNYRNQALIFSMRAASDSRGSTLYSFVPLIGESIAYEDSTKAAVAVAGVDTLATIPGVFSYTQQTRNKTTKNLNTPEFFDQFDTDTVVIDPLTAQHEAEAAENRNTFPYRATVEVLGYAALRPDMPIYLEGIGEYSGYWVILSTEHRVIEEELNRQKYTTILEVGTDSLGRAKPWFNNETIVKPNEKAVRKIIPGMRQTLTKPKTNLSRIVRANDSAKSSFGTVQNRAKPNVDGRSTAPTTWKTGTRSPSKIAVEPKKSASVITRLAKR